MICWILQLERNNIIFQHFTPIRSTEIKFITLITFWYTAQNASQLLKFTLILP
jgi:hypothetical protein